MRRKPKRPPATGYQGLPSGGVARIGQHLRTSKCRLDTICHPGKRMQRPNRTIHFQLSLPALDALRAASHWRCKLCSPRLDPETSHRRKPHIMAASIPRPRLQPLSFVPPRRRICKRSRYMSHGVVINPASSPLSSSLFPLTWHGRAVVQYLTSENPFR